MPKIFAVQLPDGTIEQYEVTPGGKLRLVVGERNVARGAVWNVWATPNSGDFYIADGIAGGIQKWSFHASGNWSHKFHKTEHAEQQARATGYTGRRRVVDEWEQPAELGESGVTWAFSIRIRRQDLQKHDDSRLPQDIYWVPPPPEGAALYLNVCILREIGRAVELDVRSIGVPLCGFGLADNRQVLVCASTQPVSDETNAQIDRWIDGAVGRKPDAYEESESYRLLIHSTAPDGHRMVWDLAIPPERLRRPASTTAS